MDIDVTESVETFRQLLDVAWPLILPLSDADKTGSFIDDWLQSNWERIVEASIDPELGITVQAYGEGADCNIRSSRVWKPDAQPTAFVVGRYVGNEGLINIIDGRPVECRLEVRHFCAIRNGWPVIDQPFDHMVVESAEIVVVPVRDLRYFVRCCQSNGNLSPIGARMPGGAAVSP